MMFNLRIAAPILAGLLLAMPPVTALAGPARSFEIAQGGQTPQTGSQVPLSRVLHELAQRYGGKQLNTTMGQAGGRPAYLVQWQLTNGRVVVITVDAQTGQVVG